MPEAAVDAAARGLAVHKWPTALGVWDSFGQSMRDDFRDQARAALEAAAPHMLASAQAEAWDEGFVKGSESEHDAEWGPEDPQPDWTNPYKATRG